MFNEGINDEGPIVISRNRRANGPVMAYIRLTIEEEPENENGNQSFI